MHFVKNLTQVFGSVKNKQTKDSNLSSSTNSLQLKFDTSNQVIERFLDNHLSIFTSLMKKIEQVTTVSKKSQFRGIVFFVILYLAIGQGASILCNAIGCLFPLYASVKAIESEDFKNVTKWLTYWLVFSSVNLVELFLVWFPAYYLLKFALFVWCMYPSSFNGSHFLYFTFLRPLVLSHQKTVDGALFLVADSLKNARNVTERTFQQGKSMEVTDSATLTNGNKEVPKTHHVISEKEIKQD